MAKDKGYERGIKDDADYGTQFLNARAGASGDEGAPPPPPPPTPGDDEPAPSRGVGLVVMILLIVGAIGAGIAGFLIFGGDSGGSSGDLVTAGDVEIDADGFPVRETTTTTEKPESTTTTTSSSTTTSTTLATTSTTASTVPVPTTVAVPVTPPPTQAPSCPGGSSQTTLQGPYSATGANQYRLDLSGTTTNDTTAAFDLTLVVRVQHEPTAGQVKTIEVRTDQNGQSVPAGGSIAWTATANLRSVSAPQPLGAGGSWRWSDAQYAPCPTGTFG